jgi:squalene synthase HpnC
MENYALPEGPLADLLSAFAQDIQMTRDARSYAGRTELLDYCARSANPIGRLLLHLYEVHDAKALRQSDAICTALQLINFWQDMRVDLPRGRHYVPLADAARHGLSHADLARQAAAGKASPATCALVRELVAWARGLMLQGAPLAHRIPGRAGWELRLVAQGGLRILDKIAAQGYDTLARRPAVGAGDVPLLLWRALAMAPRAPLARSAA